MNRRRASVYTRWNGAEAARMIDLIDALRESLWRTYEHDIRAWENEPWRLTAQGYRSDEEPGGDAEQQQTLGFEDDIPF